MAPGVSTRISNRRWTEERSIRALAMPSPSPMQKPTAASQLVEHQTDDEADDTEHDGRHDRPAGLQDDLGHRGRGVELGRVDRRGAAGSTEGGVGTSSVVTLGSPWSS